MYSKEDIIKGITALGIKPTDTLMVHSSMKAIGSVENGADTVIDALMSCTKDGLLVLPTHTWRQINNEYNVFDPKTEPSCVGILTDLFWRRPGVLRSLHPTHSVGAYGIDAAEYIAGEETRKTPCSREGCYGRLYDRKAKILFVGCTLKSNTYIHMVEEWHDIPLRLSDTPQHLKVVLESSEILDCPSYRHSSPFGAISRFYGKLAEPFLALGIAVKGRIGDADCYLCDAVAMADVTGTFLKKDPALFSNDKPVPVEWYL